MEKINDRTIITIGRTFGSGGSEIAKKVSEQLKIPFYDNELLRVEADISQDTYHGDEIKELDEKKVGLFLNMMAFNPGIKSRRAPLENVIQEIQISAIKSVASKGSCVIVGRRADKVLRDEYNILSVFITAPMDNRIYRISKRDGISREESRKEILRVDKTRRAYYNAYKDGDWSDASNYHLCVNSGIVGIDGSVDIILQYLQYKNQIDSAEIKY